MAQITFPETTLATKQQSKLLLHTTKEFPNNRLIHRKTVRFAFLKKVEIVLITSFTILLNYEVSTLPLSNHFYPSIITHKTLWPNRQDRRLLTHGTFKNASLKQVRGRLHGCGTLTSKEALGT